MMARIRPILSVVLVAIATLIVSCGSATPKAPPTYTPEVLQKVQLYTPGVVSLRQRFPELEQSIQTKNWVDVQSFIHGPLGELRTRVNRLAATLLPDDAKQAQIIADDLYAHLERLDAAADEGQQVIAGQEYRNALDDFDTFLSLIPEQS